MTPDQDTPEIIDSAAGAAKSAVEATAAWTADAAGPAELADRLETVVQESKNAVDVAAAGAKDASADAWEVAKRAKDATADAARGGYERAQQLGADIATRTQDQPFLAIATAFTAGLVIGFALSSMLKAR
jgi:ElaB/YqjD/DUF883 family membrane-anchored ribosome-binding protein